MDHYTTLGIDKSASAEEIKQAYRRMAARHHPDRGGDTAKFQEVEQAYRILSDPAAKAAYDNPQPDFSGFPGFNGRGFDFDSIFDMFGARFQSNMRPQARIQLFLNLVDVLETRQQLIQVNTPQGSQAIEITIPRGIEDGDTMQFPGVAPGGLDLIVVFRIRPDERWTRRGNNIITEVRINFFELIAGCTVPIRDLRGEKIDIQVPAMTRPDQQLRLRGQGLPDRNGQMGDILIKFNASLPDTVSPELLESIRRELTKK